MGIVGLPNAGKSTLFNALLGRSVANTAPYPFCTIEPNVGVVGVPDARLEQLNKVLEPGETVPAAIEFYDIAGLVEGAHQGEGLGNEFLSHIREVDVILHLVRNFESKGVEVVGSANPCDDMQIINTELMLKDLATVNKLQIQSAGRRTKFQIKEKRERVRRGAVGKLQEVLEEGRMAVEAELTKEEEEAIKDLNLLTLKPQLVVVNVGEEAFGEERPNSQTSPRKDLRGLKDPGPGGRGIGEVLPTPIEISAKLEEDLSTFSKEERLDYMEELGIESGLDKIIGECYKLLDLITFYTVKGGEILRAWPLESGSTAIEAAEKVHSDFAENFIRAEVVQAEDLIEAGSWLAAKEEGVVDVRGRDYVVKDGDTIEFKV